ncbi:MAG: hypothetical protein P4L16_04835 [Chlamydiales bacterium]|nr:hypothetical protein [Chlamydiales bacterium]
MSNTMIDSLPSNVWNPAFNETVGRSPLLAPPASEPTELRNRIEQAATDAISSFKETTTSGKEITGWQIYTVLSARHEDIHSRINDYFNDIEVNSAKTKKVQKLQQCLRSQSGDNGVDWSHNTEMQVLLNACRGYGVVVDTGKFTFTEAEKTALLANTDTALDGLMTSNKNAEMRLSYFKNMELENTTTLANLLKAVHEAVMAIVHNIGK